MKILGLVTFLSLFVLFVVGCQSIGLKERGLQEQEVQGTHVQDDRLYRDLGGLQGIESLVDLAIEKIQNDPRVFHHFDGTNWDRFREKQIEHICVLAGGGCTYTGDTMIDVHTGMNINEAEFNAIADNIYRSMEKLDIPVGARNRLLAILARMRGEVIYR